jgi:ribosomal protein L11 methyltransferase
LRLVSVRVARERAEEARARILELAPAGFEEAEGTDGAFELRVYTDPAGDARIRTEFEDVRTDPVAPGWEDAWRRFHRPVRVGPLWVGPPWEAAPHGAIAVVIDPGRAFGTGAHPTTQLCLELLVDLGRGSLVDLGCGSGVLAIAAGKLGFAPVTALDADAAAVAATQANARANAVELEARLSDVRADSLPSADVAVANIALADAEALAARVEARSLVTSGYLARERRPAPAWRHVERRERDGWAADSFEAEG